MAEANPRQENHLGVVLLAIFHASVGRQTAVRCFCWAPQLTSWESSTTMADYCHPHIWTGETVTLQDGRQEAWGARIDVITGSAALFNNKAVQRALNETQRQTGSAL